MSFFHTHQWVEHGRHFNAPHPELIKKDYEYPASLAFQLIHGYTVVLLKCATCGDQKITEVIGDARVK